MILRISEIICDSFQLAWDRFPVVSVTGEFSVATDGTMCPVVDSASKNDYQGFILG
jgi:hypothetical protein